LKTTRREFVGSLSAAVLCSTMPSAFARQAAGARAPIAFSTLGCPAWDFQKILDFAAHNGFAAIELRGLQGNLDLPSHEVFAPGRIEETKREITSRNLKIACVSSSTDAGEADAGKRAKGFADARRFIDLAAALNAPYVRVFGRSGDSDKPVVPDAELKRLVASGLRELGEYGGQHGVTVILESHDDFTSSATLQEVLSRADSPHVGLLWDAFHTYVNGNEQPGETFKIVRPWVRHTHLKDGVGTGPERKYVLTGRGNIPVRQQIELLHASGYKGYYCFEWEKLWHPDLEDPEIAIADYAKVARGYLENMPARREGM
jgi:sugar phosphate isomerase/epimerase